MVKILAGPGPCFPIRLDKKELDIERTNSEYDRSWQRPSNRELGDRARARDSMAHNAFGKAPQVRSGLSLCTRDAQTLSSNEDRQHLDCATPGLQKIDYKKSDVLRFHRRGQAGVEGSALPVRPVWL